MPVKVFAGENCLLKNGAALKGLGKNAFIVTGKHSAKASGALDDAFKALGANGQGGEVFDGVMNNPTTDCAKEAAAACKKAGCDFVLAIGGGSPLDAAKAAAVLAVNDISIEQLFNKEFAAALPIIAVPTTAGTGSETTPYSVLIDTTGERLKKRSVGTPDLFPRIAFLDARYTQSLGKSGTIHTTVDALSHAVEGLISVRANPVSDGLARESIALIAGCLGELADFPADGKALSLRTREILLTASSIAGMVIAQTGTTAVHSMGYMFTLAWGTDHGRANGLLLAEYLKILERKESALPAQQRRIPAVCKALGMGLDEFSALLSKLLVKTEKAKPEEIDEWLSRSETLRSAANCYITISKEEAAELFRKAAG